MVFEKEFRKRLSCSLIEIFMFISVGALAGILFSLFIFMVALAIVILLYRDLRSRQSAYLKFSDQLNEFVVTMTKDGFLEDILPKHVSDPLYEQLLQEQSFDRILSITDLNRLNDYIRGLNAYPNIPFIFAYNSEQGVLWYSLRAVVNQTGNDSRYIYMIKNVTLDVESRNQRDLIQKKMDLLLQSTGDFLWSMEVEKRQFTLLTPVTDDEGRVVPRSVGVQDIHTLLPDEDFALFAKMVNARIVDFRASGHDNEESRAIKVRLYGLSGKMVWYSFRFIVGYDENSRLMLKGAARRMDPLVESPIFEGDDVRNALAAMAFSFPDVAMFCADRDFKLVSCNLTFAMEHGMSSIKKLEGMYIKDLLKTMQAKSFVELCSKTFESGRPVAWRGSFGEDRVVLLNISPLEKNGVVSRVLCTYIHMDRKNFDKAQNEGISLL